MEWKEVTLGDFMQCNPKRAIKKGQKARKITMDLLIPHSKTIRNWNYEPYSGGAKFQNGDTIMARITPCLENGKHAFVSILDKGEIAYGSTEYFVFCGKEEVSDNDFVYYLTKTPLFRDTAIKSMVGSSGRQRAQMDVLENLKMLVPKDISDQRRIASILSSLDRKIELNNKINADLEEMAQAIFKNWFVDFEPFKDGKFVDSELGMIPEGWRVGTIGDIVEFQNGFAFSSKDFSENGEYKIITIKSVQDGCLVTEGSSKVTEYPTKMPAYCKLQSGDILLSLTGNVGRCCLVTETNLLLNQRVAKIKAKECYDNSFSYALFRLKETKELLISISRGTAQANLSPVEASKLPMVIPSEDARKKFSMISGSIMDKITSIHIENRTLSTLRDTLLPRLMSGEIEVPE
uniref:restriction endonuclease subunit S n=1 Tax=Prevotella sp. TaxID=59823 RepID=UPI003FEEB134